jgi:hypothetical protein
MSSAKETAPLWVAYQEQNGRLLTRSLTWTNAIAMVAMPGGAALDYFLYPAHFVEFLLWRLGDALFLLACVGLLYVGGQRYQFLKAKTLGVLSALSVTGAISFMIYRTEGAQSPYFAGVNLATLCFAAMMPWSLVQTLLMCAGTLLFYVVACVLNPSAAQPSFLPYLGFNASSSSSRARFAWGSRSSCPGCASRTSVCVTSSMRKIASFRISTASRRSSSRTSATSCALRSRSSCFPSSRCWSAAISWTSGRTRA